MTGLPRENILLYLKGIIPVYAAKPVCFSESIAINTDLGIHGDDANEFLEMIQKQFGTDFYMLDWQVYFYNETEGSGLFQNTPLAPYLKKIPITVGHLAHVIQKGMWFEPQS